jgi:CheY-like chemotaxis protein
MLVVNDNGTGMDEATRQRVFEPFFTTKGSTGTGLGLATCYGIVSQAGGFIWPSSALGTGATFKIYVPRARGDSVRPRAIRASLAPPRGSERVLVVEDEPLVRALTVRTLEAHGYQVTLAADAAAAYALCADTSRSFDLLLTDVVMPGINGGELATSAMAHRPGLRVLFMSGFTPSAILHKAVMSGEVDLLEKPISTEKLARTVREVLDRARS